MAAMRAARKEGRVVWRLARNGAAIGGHFVLGGAGRAVAWPAWRCPFGRHALELLAASERGLMLPAQRRKNIVLPGQQRRIRLSAGIDAGIMGELLLKCNDIMRIERKLWLKAGNAIRGITSLRAGVGRGRARRCAAKFAGAGKYAA